MTELDHAELTATHLALRKMKLALIGARIRSGNKHTKKLKVLNFKKAIRSHDTYESLKESKMRKHDLTNTMHLLQYSKVLCHKCPRFLLLWW